MFKRKDHSGRASDNETAKKITRAKKNQLNNTKKETDLYQEYKKSNDQYKMTFFQFKRKKEGKTYAGESNGLNKNLKLNTNNIRSLSDHSIRKLKKKKGGNKRVSSKRQVNGINNLSRTLKEKI